MLMSCKKELHVTGHTKRDPMLFCHTNSVLKVHLHMIAH